nr:tetratricopeptide repeat protein [Allomuricauda sp.]
MLRHLFVLIFTSVCSCVFGQLKSSYSRAELDSLFIVWEDITKADTSRLKAMTAYSWYKFVFSAPDSALYYADLQLQLANKTDAKTYIAAAFSTKGTAFWVKGDYEKSITYFEKNLEVAKVVGKKNVIASAYNKLGIVYGDVGDVLRQIAFYEKSLKIREEIGDLEPIAITLGNIGQLYLKEGNYTKALECQQRCLKIREELGDQSRVAFALANIGAVHESMEDFDTALAYYRRSLTLGEKHCSKKSIAWFLSNMGNVLKRQGDYSKAHGYYRRSMALLQTMGAKPEIVDLLGDRGELYFLQADYSKSISDCKSAHAISAEIGDIRRQKESCECLYKSYKKIRNGNQALYYHENMVVLSDSLQSREAAKRLQQMEFARIRAQDSILRVNEARIAAEKLKYQESRISLLNSKNRAKTLWIIFGSLAAVLFIGLLYYRYQQRVKYQKLQNDFLNSELEYKKQDLTNFAVNISNNQEWALSLSEKLEDLKNSTGRKRTKELEDLELEIKNKIWVDKGTDDFYSKVDSLSSSFFDKLTSQFKGLTKNEIRLCSLIKLDLDTKQIAALQNISPTSVKMSRHRLRKKLNLSPEDDLNLFLRAF